MNSIRIFAVFLIALLAGCAGMQSTPGAGVKQALAPTGKLRVALFTGTSAHIVRDPASGQIKAGVGHDLGKALAGRLGVPFEPVVYTALAPLFSGARDGAWDVAFVGVNDERRKFLDFGDKHLELDIGYLVPSGSPIVALADVDRPGVRIAVLDKSSPYVMLSRTVRNAELVRFGGLPEALQSVKAGNAQVFGGVKTNLYGFVKQFPGGRVIEGRAASEDQAIAIPAGRPAAALSFAREFIDDAKRQGVLRDAIERAGLRDARVVFGN